MYKYITEQQLRISQATVWEFFSSPVNLSKITPPDLRFHIPEPHPETDIYEGMPINYTVKPILHIPVRWTTRIGNTIRFHSFTDIQVAGTY